MFILKRKEKNSEDNTFFISQEEPNILDKDVITQIYYGEVSDKILDVISLFYKVNYKIGRTISTYKVSPKELKNYLRLGCDIFTIHKEKMIGSFIGFYFPVKITTKLNQDVLIKTSEEFKSILSEDTIIFSYLSFLAVEKKYRGKGYGIYLMQKGSNYYHGKGGLAGLFINTKPKCANYIKLNNWYFPLKLENKKGFGSYSYKKMFELRKPEETVIQIDENNCEEYLNFYLDMVKDKIFKFYPNLYFFQKWIISFPTFVVLKNSSPIGLFSFNSTLNYDPSINQDLKTGSLLLCVGKQPETLYNSIYKCKEFNDCLYISETGDLDQKILSKVNAQKINTNYINFYNSKINLLANDIYFPIF